MLTVEQITNYLSRAPAEHQARVSVLVEDMRQELLACCEMAEPAPDPADRPKPARKARKPRARKPMPVLDATTEERDDA